MRRIVNQVTKPAIRATPITPPTTLPAITPVSEPPLKDVLGVIVGWPLLVEVGTIEALPVTSGDSVARQKYIRDVVALAKIRTAGGLCQRFVPGTGLRGNEKGFGREKGGRRILQ
jgi:hypothetical protein